MATKILLIEDNPDYSLITRRILKRASVAYEVVTVSEGKAGIDEIINEEFNVILCDYRLPGYSGLDILRQMKKHGKDIPFIVVTSAGSEKIAVDLMKEGASDYLVKDTSYENILPMVIQRAIDRFNARKEKEWLEKALIDSNEKLKQMYAIKSDFTSMVSHELRTPLTAIREGISIVLDQAVGEINNDQREFLMVAKRNVDRLKRLIDDVLDFSKLESKRMEFKMTAEDLNMLVQEVVEAQRSVAQKKGLSVEIDLDSTFDRILFDRDRITQVLTNLMSNAIKFTQNGEIIVRTKKDNNSNVVVLSVQDAGAGISEEDLPKLFQKFQQLGRGNARKTGGTGLGLAISKQIIEQHGGKIWVESEIGKGSIFFCTFLIKRDYEILIIDDEQVVLDVCVKFLEKDNYLVKTSLDGETGINIAKEWVPDGIILDMKLTGMSGYEVVGRLKSIKETADIPILVISGYVDEIERIKSPPDEISLPWILKPLDVNKFLAQVKELVSGV